MLDRATVRETTKLLRPRKEFPTGNMRVTATLPDDYVRTSDIDKVLEIDILPEDTVRAQEQ
jgi:hypothetical protein